VEGDEEEVERLAVIWKRPGKGQTEEKANGGGWLRLLTTDIQREPLDTMRTMHCEASLTVLFTATSCCRIDDESLVMTDLAQVVMP
jgi:hypothetical protein